MATEENVIPLIIPIYGTLGDDVYWVFTDFTIDGVEYPLGTTAELYLELKEAPVATKFTLPGTFDPEGNSTLTRLSFKFEAADNLLAEEYDYDIKVTYANGDVFTHVKGVASISKDVRNAKP